MDRVPVHVEKVWGSNPIARQMKLFWSYWGVQTFISLIDSGVQDASSWNRQILFLLWNSNHTWSLTYHSQCLLTGWGEYKTIYYSTSVTLWCQNNLTSWLTVHTEESPITWHQSTSIYHQVSTYWDKVLVTDRISVLSLTTLVCAGWQKTHIQSYFHNVAGMLHVHEPTFLMSVDVINYHLLSCFENVASFLLHCVLTSLHCMASLPLLLINTGNVLAVLFVLEILKHRQKVNEGGIFFPD
jgi:hypothetical protein